MSRDSLPRQAGVIGSNWGRVHIAGLRKAGCQVTHLMAHDAALVERIAKEEQIPHWHTELADMADCDLVTIATPTASHLGYLQALQHKAVLCEKPLGMTPENQEAFSALPSEQLFISYPFAFLDTAKQLSQRLRSGALGRLQRISLVVGVNLPYPKSRAEWFSEDVIHPFSFIFSHFKHIEYVGVRLGEGNNMSVQFHCDGALMDVLLCDWPTQGLHFDLTLVGSQTAWQMQVLFQPELGWWVNPLWENDVAITTGEPASTSPWIQANHRVAAHFVQYLQGEISREQAWQEGAFPLERAIAMETLLMPLFRDCGQHKATDSAPVSDGLKWKTQ